MRLDHSADEAPVKCQSKAIMVTRSLVPSTLTDTEHKRAEQMVSIQFKIQYKLTYCHHDVTQDTKNNENDIFGNDDLLTCEQFADLNKIAIISTGLLIAQKAPSELPDLQ